MMKKKNKKKTKKKRLGNTGIVNMATPCGFRGHIRAWEKCFQAPFIHCEGYFISKLYSLH
jgi:hypothetical protein